jgi:GNAT superfamily N-acetyltransferase
MTIRAPEPLSATHDLSQFASSEPALDEWLHKRALVNQVSNASRTYVICSGSAAIGYYAIATASVAHAEAISRVKRNMPDPVPMILIARLAVDQNWQGKGLGAALLKDALLRIVQISDQVGVKGVLVDAIHERARTFYERWGFRQSPSLPLRLMITLTELRKELGIPTPHTD